MKHDGTAKVYANVGDEVDMDESSNKKRMYKINILITTVHEHFLYIMYSYT